DARPRRPDRPGPLPPRPRGRLGEPRPRGGARGRRLPVRPGIRRARRDRRPRRGAVPGGRDPRPGPRRGAPARADPRPGHERRRLPGPLCAQDREAVRGRVPARQRRRRGPRRVRLALGIAFQIADDILDCTGETIETGKIAGTDLREGTPTLPLILAAREDATVRRALAGGPLDGAL